MNYIDPACMESFTDEQIFRMRYAYMYLRSSLMGSLGCEPACTDVEASFTMPDITINQNGTMLIRSTTDPIEADHLWTVDGMEYTTTNIEHTFNIPGLSIVCLTAVYNDCPNRFCDTILVIPANACYDSLNYCGLLRNGDLREHNIPFNTSHHFSGNSGQYKVCGWKVKNPTPYFCSKEFMLGAWGLWSGFEESIVSEDPMQLIHGNTYSICFEYYAQMIASNLVDNGVKLNVGLSKDCTMGIRKPTDYTLRELEIFTDDYNGRNVGCPPDDAVWRQESIVFEYDENTMGPHLYFFNDIISATSMRNIVFIRGLCVKDCRNCVDVCPPLIDSCTVAFEVCNEDTNVLRYDWDFGDGSKIVSGTNPTHTYLWKGTYSVCVTAIYSEEESYTSCITVYIQEDCVGCDEENILNLTANRCDTLNNYLIQFSFDVDKGFEPCQEDRFYMNSDDAGIAVNSYIIEVVDENTDKIHISAYVTPKPNHDLDNEPVFGRITLCGPDDQFICLLFELSGHTCESCLDLDVEVFASCDSIVDGLLYYSGTVEVDLDTPNEYNFCGSTSSESGFEGDVRETDPGTIFNFDYSIRRTQSGAFNTQVLLCFDPESEGNEICINLNITVSFPCDTMPCVQIFGDSILNLMCTEMAGSITEFEFEFDLPPGLYLCDSTTISMEDSYGISIVSTNGNQRATILTEMPMMFNIFRTYYMQLEVCNHKGELICIEVPVLLMCGSDLKDDNEPELRGIQNEVNYDLLLVPNPAKNSVRLELQGNFTATEKEVGFYNTDMRLVKTLKLSDTYITIDISDLPVGLYIIRLYDRENQVMISKKMVVQN
jgi:PKD repeat protein